MSDDQQAFYHDQLMKEREIDSLLREAEVRPLSREEIRILRFATGIPERKTVPLLPSFIAAYDPYVCPLT